MDPVKTVVQGLDVLSCRKSILRPLQKVILAIIFPCRDLNGRHSSEASILLFVTITSTFMGYKKNKSRSIYITTNVACNLRCIYCYEKDKDSLESFDLDAAIYLLSSTLTCKTELGTIINFHGGEPFLSYLKIRQLCEWAWSQKFPEKFLFFATTNGTLIHGEIKNWLEKNKDRFILGLSLDGTRQMHNINRTNSFNLIDLDFFAKTWPQQGVKMTISPMTIGNLAEGVIFAHEKGFKEISANLAEMTDWSNPIYLNQYRTELSKLTDYYLKHPEIKKCSLFEVNFGSIMNTEHKRWCGIGNEIEALDVDGSAHPCHLFFESVCGKDKSQLASHVDFSNPETFISDECRDCPILNVCPTCAGANYIARGDVAKRDMSLCEFTKIRIAEVAKFYYKKIVDSSIDISTLPDEEKVKALYTLEGIEKVAEFLHLEK